MKPAQDDDGFFAYHPHMSRFDPKPDAVSPPAAVTFREALLYWLKLGFISFGNPNLRPNLRSDHCMTLIFLDKVVT